MKCKLIPRHSFAPGPLERQNTRSRLLQNTKNCKRNIQKKPQKKRCIYIKKKLIFFATNYLFSTLPLRYLLLCTVKRTQEKRKRKITFTGNGDAFTNLAAWLATFYPSSHNGTSHIFTRMYVYVQHRFFFFFWGGNNVEMSEMRNSRGNNSSGETAMKVSPNKVKRKAI